MNRDDTLTALYNHYFTLELAKGRREVVASVEAHETACQTMRDLDYRELKFFLKQNNIAV